MEGGEERERERGDQRLSKLHLINFTSCRSFMTELLFEGYGVPALSYGIDALFSAHHHWSRRGAQLRDALVISSGQQTTHIIPLLDGRVDTGHCKRCM